MRYVEFDEPFANLNQETVGALVRVEVSDAIKVQKYIALQRGHVYESEERALEDFLTIHWGRIVESNS